MILTVPVHWNRTQGHMTMVFRLSTTESQCPRIVVVTGRSGHSPALCNFSIIASLKLGNLYERRLQAVSTEMPARQFSYCMMDFQVSLYFLVWFFTLTTMLCFGLASGLLVRKEAVCPGQIWAFLSTQGPWSAELAGLRFLHLSLLLRTQASLPVLLFHPPSLS